MSRAVAMAAEIGPLTPIHCVATSDFLKACIFALYHARRRMVRSIAFEEIVWKKALIVATVRSMTGSVCHGQRRRTEVVGHRAKYRTPAAANIADRMPFSCVLVAPLVPRPHFMVAAMLGRMSVAAACLAARPSCSTLLAFDLHATILVARNCPARLPPHVASSPRFRADLALLKGRPPRTR